MKRLVQTKNQVALVEFKGKETIFHSKFLEDEMRRCGIPIPPGMRNFFGGKDYVFLGDEKFQEAFQEVYAITTLDPKLYHWEEG